MGIISVSGGLLAVLDYIVRLLPTSGGLAIDVITNSGSRPEVV